MGSNPAWRTTDYMPLRIQNNDAEKWQRGRMHTPAKGAGPKCGPRGFESLLLRHKITTPFGVVIFMAAVRNLQCSSKVNSPCAKVYLIRYNKFRKLKRKFLDSVESPAFLCKRGKRGTSCKRVQSLFSLSGLHTAAAGNSDCRCGGQTVRRSPPPASRTTGPGRRSHTGRFRGSL